MRPSATTGDLCDPLRPFPPGAAPGQGVPLSGFDVSPDGRTIATGLLEAE
ncbi:MAG: hypothetical protein ACLQVI_28335 [Polyangiaceae bacterium]